MIDSNRFLGGMRKLRPRKSVLLEVVWLMNSNLWIHRQAIASCCISSWNPEHYLSWVISQDTCCLKAHGFSVSSCLWHSRCWAFRDTSTSLLINSVILGDGGRPVGEWCVVCGVRASCKGSCEGGAWCLWCSAASHLSESRNILWTGREQWCEWNLTQTLCANILVLCSEQGLSWKKPLLEDYPECR